MAPSGGENSRYVLLEETSLGGRPEMNLVDWDSTVS